MMITQDAILITGIKSEKPHANRKNSKTSKITSKIIPAMAELDVSVQGL